MGSHYCHLKLDERRKLAKWLEAKMPIAEIADRLGRDPSTIYRDIKRNRYIDTELPCLNGYYGMVAQHEATKRLARRRKLVRLDDLRVHVVTQLKIGWTPEQIGNRMIQEGASLRVCQETIYRYIYSKEGQRDDLWWYLPTHRVAHRPRRTRRRREPKFHRDVSILFRPDDVAHRRQFGHLEADLMLFKQKLGQTNVTSLVERVSRFTVILKNPNKRTKPVMGKIMDAIRDLPYLARQSITFDRGTGFSAWKHLKSGIGADAWFCDPHAPYQKGTLENAPTCATMAADPYVVIRHASSKGRYVTCYSLLS